MDVQLQQQKTKAIAAKKQFLFEDLRDIYDAVRKNGNKHEIAMNAVNIHVYRLISKAKPQEKSFFEGVHCAFKTSKQVVK